MSSGDSALLERKEEDKRNKQNAHQDDGTIDLASFKRGKKDEEAHLKKKRQQEQDDADTFKFQSLNSDIKTLITQEKTAVNKEIEAINKAIDDLQKTEGKDASGYVDELRSAKEALKAHKKDLDAQQRQRRQAQTLDGLQDVADSTQNTINQTQNIRNATRQARHAPPFNNAPQTPNAPPPYGAHGAAPPPPAGNNAAQNTVIQARLVAIAALTNHAAIHSEFISLRDDYGRRPVINNLEVLKPQLGDSKVDNMLATFRNILNNPNDNNNPEP